MPLAIAGINFNSRSAVIKYARTILWRWSKQPETRIDGEDEIFLKEYVKLHHAYQEQITGFIVRWNNPYGGKAAPGFWALLANGGEWSWSYKTPINGPNNQSDKIIHACRKAIVPIVDGFKKDAFAHGMPSCAITGELLSWENAVVDHGGEWPFRRIVDEYLVTLVDAGAFWRVPLKGIEKYEHFWVFSSQPAREHWIRFHNRRAQLQIVSRTVNLQHGSRGYRSRFIEPKRE